MSLWLQNAISHAESFLESVDSKAAELAQVDNIVKIRRTDLTHNNVKILSSSAPFYNNAAIINSAIATTTSTADNCNTNDYSINDQDSLLFSSSDDLSSVSFKTNSFDCNNPSIKSNNNWDSFVVDRPDSFHNNDSLASAKLFFPPDNVKNFPETSVNGIHIDHSMSDIHLLRRDVRNLQEEIVQERCVLRSLRAEQQRKESLYFSERANFLAELSSAHSILQHKDSEIIRLTSLLEEKKEMCKNTFSDFEGSDISSDDIRKLDLERLRLKQIELDVFRKRFKVVTDEHSQELAALRRDYMDALRRATEAEISLSDMQTSMSLTKELELVSPAALRSLEQQLQVMTDRMLHQQSVIQRLANEKSTIMYELEVEKKLKKKSLELDRNSSSFNDLFTDVEQADSVTNNRGFSALSSQRYIPSRVVGAARLIDSLSTQAGSILRRHALLRTGIFVYLLLLHFYVIIIVWHLMHIHSLNDTTGLHRN